MVSTFGLPSANRFGSPRNTSVANAVIGPHSWTRWFSFSISVSNFAYIVCNSLRR